MSAGAGQHKARADADQLTKSGRAQRKHTAQTQSAEHLRLLRLSHKIHRHTTRHTPHATYVQLLRNMPLQNK